MLREKDDTSYTVRGGGLGLGTFIAAYLSYVKWHSLGWLVLHGIFGWFYVLYYWLMYGGSI